MKLHHFALFSIFFLLITSPCVAQDRNFRIEVLQVTNIEPFNKSFEGFKKVLESNGLVQGRNLTLNRTVIDFDLDKAGLWKKVGVLFRIRSEAGRIADSKPDLVLTIGTPATKYAKGTIISAGIPLVFTAVAIPEAAGCESLKKAGPGFTGATLYMSMDDAMKRVKLAFPSVKTLGIIHSDDENGIVHVEEAQKSAPNFGLKLLTEELGKNDRITPALEDLAQKGAGAFCVPLDTYYGLRNYEACREMELFSNRSKIPVISFALMKVPGAFMYIGSDFQTIGELSGQQAVRILKEGTKPADLPILMQKEPRILVDSKRLAQFNFNLPKELMDAAQIVDFSQKTYRIEVLQVTDIEPFERAYEGFREIMKKNGLVEGKNLSVTRKIIDFDMDNSGMWSKMGVLMRIRSEASRIAELRPDLVLTIGTPATKYAKDRIIEAGVPVVFTAVAIPEEAGCRSTTESGPGFTGSTLYMNMHNALKLMRLAFPNVKKMGIIYSDDENGTAHAEQAKKYGPADVGITFLTKEVGKNDRITPLADELKGEGVEAFAVPLDTYYALRKYEAAKDLRLFSLRTGIPIFSFALVKMPGSMLYIGSDFGFVGQLSGNQAVKILKEGVRPETIPVYQQQDLRILVDPAQIKELNYKLPMEILQISQEVQ